MKRHRVLNLMTQVDPAQRSDPGPPGAANQRPMS